VTIPKALLRGGHSCDSRLFGYIAESHIEGKGRRQVLAGEPPGATETSSWLLAKLR
jgi:hypothetical protein